ncbi:hypothetical protein D3C87_2109310 [compost metagenome]
MRKHIDRAVDRVGHGIGVHGRIGQVALLGNLDRLLDRLRVAGFAENDDFGLAAQ